MTKFRKWERSENKLYLFEFFINFHLISGIYIPFFLNWGNLTFVEVMFIQSYFTIMVLVFENLCGAFADYFSRKFALLIAGISKILVALIYSSYPSIFIFLIGETLWAFTAALISGTDQSILYDHLKIYGQEEKVSEKIAKMQIFILMGIAVSAPIGSLIAEFISLPAVMFFMCIPFAIGTVMVLLIKEPYFFGEDTEKQSYFHITKSGFTLNIFLSHKHPFNINNNRVRVLKKYTFC